MSGLWVEFMDELGQIVGIVHYPTDNLKEKQCIN